MTRLTHEYSKLCLMPTHVYLPVCGPGRANVKPWRLAECVRHTVWGESCSLHRSSDWRVHAQFYFANISSVNENSRSFQTSKCEIEIFPGSLQIMRGVSLIQLQRRFPKVIPIYHTPQCFSECMHENIWAETFVWMSPGALSIDLLRPSLHNKLVR